MATLVILRYILLLGSYNYLTQCQKPKSFLIRSSPTLFSNSESSGSSCQFQSAIDKESTKARNIINQIYKLRPGLCGGPGWTRVGYLNMSDTNQQCPSNWTLQSGPIRGCTQNKFTRDTCDSVVLATKGEEYSNVCGRVNAYQKYINLGVSGYIKLNTLEESYVTGVSVTHGVPGTRQHVWTFISNMDYNRNNSCNCKIDFILPSSVGNNYFCDTGTITVRDKNDDDTTYNTDNPLWDGEGCERYSTCCNLNNPPWFYRSLGNETNDYLEIRLCKYSSEFEIVVISLMEIYVK